MEIKPELIPTRQTLLSRLKDADNHESWREFFDTYWKLIYSAATRAGLSDAEAQDVVQETIISVCRNIGTFEYDAEIGSFKGWLLKLTRWRILDQLRKRRPEQRISKGPKANWNSEAEQAELESVPDPGAAVSEAYWDQEWERNVFETAIERAKQRVDPKQFQIFDLYVLKEWSVSKISSLMGVNAAQIYLIKHRVSRVIQKELEAVRKNEPQGKKGAK
jgi:RNA polymerase sigma-70 factor (ECF subfamily)